MSRLKEWYGCIEANSYQQGWFVPHDVPGMVNLMGGKEKVIADLTDSVSYTHLDVYKRQGLKYREISERLGISVNTVECQMGIALKKVESKTQCNIGCITF